MRFKILTIVVLVFMISCLIAQSSHVTDWYVVENVEEYSHPETSASPAEDLAHCAEVGSTYTPPPEPSEEAKRAYEEYVRSLRQKKNPPVVVIDLDLPRTDSSIPRETLEDGHVLRDSSIYLKPNVEFTEIGVGTAVLQLIPLNRSASVSASSTVRDAMSRIDRSHRALSTVTPEGEIYIDITEIAEAIRSGRCSDKLVLSPLSPRERFELPEGRESVFEVVYSVE